MHGFRAWRFETEGDECLSGWFAVVALRVVCCLCVCVFGIVKEELGLELGDGRGEEGR